jgi:hypothetical protein
MDNSEHTHWLSFSWSLGNIILGAFMLFIVFGTFVANAQDMISSKLGIADYLGIVILIFFIFPLGLFFLSTPFVTKIIVKSNGFEYHTTTYVLLADWKNLINMGYARNTNAGKTMVVVPREGKLTLRNWAKPFRKIFKHNLKDIEILISMFRASNGHSLDTDILVNISQHTELLEQ